MKLFVTFKYTLHRSTQFAHRYLTFIPSHTHTKLKSILKTKKLILSVLRSKHKQVTFLNNTQHAQQNKQEKNIQYLLTDNKKISTIQKETLCLRNVKSTFHTTIP